MFRVGRRSRRLSLAVLAACLSLGSTTLASGVAAGAEPGSGALVGPAPAPSAHLPLREVLREPLWQLASGRLSVVDQRRLLSGLVTDDLPVDPAIAVSIELDGLVTSPTLAALVRAGARIVNSAGRTVEAYVATDGLSALAGVDAVRAVRPIRRHPATGSPSPVAALHRSAAWQAAGLTGTGVKVGIIDGGFSGMASRLGNELPAVVHARCYAAVGTFTANLGDCANGETHGTAVAEAISDMAPGIDLYVANPISSLDEKRAVAWMTGNGVRIINASFFSGLIFEGPGDGTSPYGDSLYGLVDQAVAAGALWVNAAGNAGDSGWTGAWSDANNNGLLEFAPGVETDNMTLGAGADVTVAIRWADPWGASANNYDLELYSGTTLVASSTDVQAGAGDPFEVVEYQAPRAGTYGIRIRRVSGAPTPRMQLLVGTAEDVKLTQQVAQGTLPTPADSANPGMLAVGAVKLGQPSVIEPYSSRGPTLDGRTKPDLVAADCAPTTIDNPFCGTSEAAPFVTGAAAEVLQARPRLTPTQLADWLRSHAIALGDPVPNSTFGAGRLDLGELPFSPPAALAFALPPTGAVAGAPLTGQPAVQLLDAAGLVVGLGPGSTTSVSISLASNAAGATLACPGGLTRGAVGGVATFDGCAVDRPGSGYVIRADAAGLPPVASAPFDILDPGSALPLTLAARRSTITLGAAAALTASFAPAPDTAGQPLTVERSVDGLHWTSAGSLPTDATGGLVVSPAPTVTGWYRVRFVGGSDLPAATSYPVRVIVRQSIVLAASIPPARTITPGTTVTFTSIVRPVGAGLPRAMVNYVVYRRIGTAWVLYRRFAVVTDASGRARLAWRFSLPGSWYVRSSAAATTSNGASGWSVVAQYDVR
jgi:hypothetical protein